MFDFIKNNPIIFILIFLAIVAPSFLFGAMQVIFYIVLGVIILLLILSLIFRAKIRNIQNQMNNQMGGNQSSEGSRGGFYYYSSRGKTTNNSQPNSSQQQTKVYTQKGANPKRVSKDVGDYVDFEELD